MATYPSLPLWTDAYLSDTMHLTLEEHGAYLKLLMIIWRTQNCSIPDDDRRIATMLNVTYKKWISKLKPSLIEFFMTDENGHLTQKKLLKVRKNVEDFRSKQSTNAQARWLKTNKTSDAMGVPKLCQTYANHNHNHIEEVSITPLSPLPGGEIKPIKKRKKKSNMPENWTPNIHAKTVALNEGFDDDERRIILQQFTDYAASSGKQYADWDAAFYNWIRSGITRNDISQRRRSDGKAGNGKAPGSIVASVNRFIDQAGS